MVTEILVAGAVGIAGLRASGHKGNVYKSIAHVYVGLLFGLGLGMFRRGDDDCKVFLIAAVGLTFVEIVAFVFTRFIPWLVSRSKLDDRLAGLDR